MNRQMAADMLRKTRYRCRVIGGMMNQEVKVT